MSAGFPVFTLQDCPPQLPAYFIMDTGQCQHAGDLSRISQFSENAKLNGGLMACVTNDLETLDTLQSAGLVAMLTLSEATDYLMMDQLEKELLDEEE